MTSHKDHRLDQIGILSQDEADELERELHIRFDQFTYHDRKVWNEQNSYLDEFAQTRTVSHSADMAGVTVYTAQTWKYADILSFTRRLEVADLRFSDNLQVAALERAREPDAPASLLIALLRAHIPEKYSTNGHVCDTAKSDEILFRLRQDAHRELAAGHPTLRAIANGTHERQPSHDDYDNPTDDFDAPDATPDDYPPFNPEEASFHNLSPTDQTSVGAGFKPAHDLSTGEETPNADSSPTTPLPSASPAPSAVNRRSRAIASLHQTARRNPNDDHDILKVTRF